MKRQLSHGLFIHSFLHSFYHSFQKSFHRSFLYWFIHSSQGSSPGAGGLWGHAQLKWGEYNAVAESDPHNLPKGELDCFVEGPTNVTYKKEKGPYTFYLVPTRFCLQVGRVSNALILKFKK